MRVGVILSGCGFKDGTAIQEAIFTMRALDEAGVEVRCYAPDRDQAKVIDHRTGEETEGRRNVLAESARIARGEIEDVAKADAEELDALILPGGFGVATSLTTFAEDGDKAQVDEGVAALVRAMHAHGKPIGAICIAPALVALVLGEKGVKLTIGNDEGVAGALEACGAKHETCAVDDVVVDVEHRIVSTPAWMLGPSIKHVAAGIERCVDEVVRLAKQPAGVS